MKELKLELSTMPKEDVEKLAKEIWGNAVDPYDNESRNFNYFPEYDFYEISFGGEGEGDYAGTVYKVTHKPTGLIGYILFEAYYDSYNGEDYHARSVAEPYIHQEIKYAKRN